MSRSPNAEVFVARCLRGAFDPAAITDRLSLAPTYQHAPGDQVGNGRSGRVHRDAG